MSTDNLEVAKTGQEKIQRGELTEEGWIRFILLGNRKSGNERKEPAPSLREQGAAAAPYL